MGGAVNRHFHEIASALLTSELSRIKMFPQNNLIRNSVFIYNTFIVVLNIPKQICLNNFPIIVVSCHI